MLTFVNALYPCFCLTYLNILIWEINSIMESISRSFIMLNTIMKKMKTQVLLIFRSLSWYHVHSIVNIIIFNMIKLLVILFIMKLIVQINILKNNNLPTKYGMTYLLLQHLDMSLIVSLFGIRHKSFC